MSVRLDHGDDDLPEVHEINVKPFIDVILVLLIIFMIGSDVLDAEALANIKRAEPLLVPPNGVAGTQLSFTLPIRYVSTGRAGTVCAVDPEAGTVVKTVTVGKRPWGLGIAPDGRRLYVANGPSDDVSVIDLDTLNEVERVKAGAGPWGVAVVADPR